MTFKQKIRKLILKVVAPVLKFLGKINFAKLFGMKLGIPLMKVMEESSIQTGDVILSRIDYLATNLVIGGFWKHAGILKTENGLVYVIEATSKGVQKRLLYKFLENKTHIMIRRPIFCEIKSRVKAVEFAENLIGLPYDWGIISTNDAYYCSEVIWASYEDAVNPSPFTPRETFGEMAVTPEDIALAKKKWELIYETSCYDA